MIDLISPDEIMDCIRLFPRLGFKAKIATYEGIKVIESSKTILIYEAVISK